MKEVLSMQSIDLYRQNNIKLGKSNPIYKVSIGKLPKGKYLYKFAIHNTQENPGTLKILLDCNGLIKDEYSLEFSTFFKEYEYSFNCVTPYELHTIIFQTDEQVDISLRLPVSAQVIQDIHNQPISFDNLDKKIISRVNDLEVGSRYKGNSQASNSDFSAGQINLSEIESFIKDRYFRGFINLDESLKQLDFVIYNKMFNPDGTKGFNRFKRRVYRKMLTFLYRKLTKNYPRKVYFAKLYRNYINSNILAENYQQHQ